MTATQDPSTLPAVIPVQQITEAREQGIEQAQQQLNAAWAFTEHLPESVRQDAQNAIMGAWNTVQMMGSQWAETQELLLRSVARVQGQSKAIDDLTKIRESVLDEMSTLLNAIQTRDINHPLIYKFYRKLYGEIAEEHNAAFWESLPYDVAQVMGKEWEHYDAGLLTDLISGGDGDEEGFAEDNGWTIEQVQHAKAKILAVVRELSNAQGDA